MVKITVIIPVYNDADRLDISLKSILKQTFKDIEIIYVNDGSTDNSLEILNEYSSKYEFIKVFSQKNQGAAIARNLAFEHSKGEYIAYLDADDFYIDDDALEKLYDVAIKNNANMVSGNIKLVDVNNNFRPFEALEYFKEYKTILPEEYGFPWSFYKNIIKKEFLLQNNIYFPDLLRGEDPTFFAEVLSKLDKIYTVPTDFYAYYYIDGGAKCDTYPKIHGTVKHYKLVDEILSDEKFNKITKEFRYQMLIFIDMISVNNAKDLLKSIRDVFSDDYENLRDCEEYFYFKYKNNPKLNNLVELKKNPTKPRISVIIPITDTFEKYDFNTILNQTLNDFEIIILINKNSKYKGELDNLKKNNINLSILENNDLKILMNNAINNSKGEFIYFLNNTKIDKNLFEDLYRNIRSNKSEVVLTKNLNNKNIDEIFKENFNFFTFNYENIKYQILNYSFMPLSGLYRKSFLENHYNFNKEQPLDEILFNLELLLNAKDISFLKKESKKIINYNDAFLLNNISKFSDVILIFDKIEIFLENKSYKNQFANVFDCFKLNQIIYFISFFDDINCFKEAKKYCLNLDISLINDYELIEKYNYIIDSSSFEEYKLKIQLNKLKNKNRNLSKKNKKMKKDIKKLQNQRKHITNSKSWKITKPIRKIKNLIK